MRVDAEKSLLLSAGALVAAISMGCSDGRKSETHVSSTSIPAGFEPTPSPQPSPTASLIKACDRVDLETSDVKSDLENGFPEVYSQDLIKLTSDFRNGNEADLVSRAQYRKQLIYLAMRGFPEAALISALPQEQLAELEAKAPGCFESHAEVEGEVRILHLDNFEEQKSEDIISLFTDSGEEIILHPAGLTHSSIESGTRIKVKGIRVDNRLVFDSSSTIEFGTDYNSGFDVISQPTN